MLFSKFLSNTGLAPSIETLIITVLNGGPKTKQELSQAVDILYYSTAHRKLSSINFNLTLKFLLAQRKILEQDGKFSLPPR